MAETHGRLGQIYKWNGTATDLAAEACTVAGAGTAYTATITSSTKRVLNPNCSDLVFTPTETVTPATIDYANGIAHYTADPGVTTCTGTGAYVLAANLVKTGYIHSFSLDIAIETHDLTAFQDKWKEYGVGLASASGTIEGFMADENWYDDLEDETDGTMQYWYIELLPYDPDDDRTGDRFGIWAIFNSHAVSIPVNEFVKESISFTVHSRPSFTANA